MQKPIKIIATVTNDLNHDQRMHRICNSLSKFDYEVLLVGRKLPNSKPLKQQKFLQKRLTCWFNKGFAFYAEYNIRVFFFLLFNRFDIVCSVDLDTLLAGEIASSLKRKKCVYDAHEYFPESAELIGRNRVQSIWRKLEQLLLPKADAVYTVSSGIQTVFQNKYKREIGLIRNVPEFIELDKNRIQKPYILYQGALNVGRGLDALIIAMQNVDIVLKIAGDGDISKDLKQLVSEKGLESKVVFLGKLAPAELKKITQEAQFGINLLERMGESYYLSLSNKFFDYIMAEIPQICIEFPSYNTINSQFEVAVLVPDLDTENLAHTINDLLQNNEKKERLKANCKLAKHELNWSKEEEKLKAIYQSIEK